MIFASLRGLTLPAVIMIILCGSLPALAQYTTAEERGLPGNSAFSGGDVDTVNLQNGNLHISIPILTETQRGGKKLEWALVFDSEVLLKKYVQQQNCGRTCPPGYYTVGHDPGTITGWRLAQPSGWSIANTYPTFSSTCIYTNEPYVPITNWYAIDPQGTQHPLSIRQELESTCDGQVPSGPSLDGSGIIYDSQANVIYLKDGTQITSSEIRDRNGNLYTFANGEDANGRVPVQVTTGSSSTTYTVTDAAGTARNYVVNYGTMNFNSSFCGGIRLTCYENTGSRSVVTSVTLPDNRSYSFTYYNNSPEEIASVTLPTGAVITYNYTIQQQTQLGPHGTLPNFVGGAAVTSRTVTADGTAQTWTYSGYPLGVGGPVSVTDPVGNVTTHTFQYVTDQGVNSSGLVETEVQYYNNSGTLLRTVQTNYADDFNVMWGLPMSIRPISVTNTLDNGQVSQTQTDYETFEYEPGDATATRMNPTEVRNYDYGSGAPGSLIRRTDYTYLHNDNSAYAAINIVDRPTSVSTYSGSGQLQAETTYEYDDYSHTNQPFSSSNAIQHDASFGTSYTLRGNQTAVSKWRSTDGAMLTSTNQYDDAGNIISAVDPMGHQSSVSFADSWAGSACVPSGNTAAYPTMTTNAGGQHTTTAYNACTGSVASTTDLNSQTTTYTYDFAGRLLSAQLPDGGTKQICYSDDSSGSCYSSSGNYAVETDAISSSTNVVKTTIYDSLGRVKQSQLNSDPDGTAYVDTQYDLDGRVYGVSNPYRFGDTEYWTTTQYDGVNRVLSTTKADGSVASTSYSGNTTLSTDEAGNSRKSQSNVLGQLTTVWENPAGLNYETDYQYDTRGDLQMVTQKGGDPNSADWRVRTFTYDSLGELLCSANPEIGSPSQSPATCPTTDNGSYIAGTVRYQYDNDGDLVTKIAPEPNQTGSATVTTTYGYDWDNRVTSISYSDGTPGVTYTFDNNAVTGCTAPALSATNLIGHMKAMCDGSGATAWSYDAMGRTAAEMRTIAGVTDTVGYTYYYDGTVNAITYPLAGRSTAYTVTYRENAAGRTDQAIGSDGTVYAQVNSTWASGSPHTMALGNNVTLTDTYNSRLQPLQTTATQISPSNTLFSRTYDFHSSAAQDNGNLYGVSDGLDGLGLNRPNGSVTYSYDAFNRLSSAATSGTDCTAMNGGTRDWASSYSVDAWGNLTAKTSTRCQGESTPASTTNNRNRLSSVVYDAAGDITQQTGVGYTYDAEGRIVNGSGTGYIYDGMGERVEKTGSKLYWKGVGSTALEETNTSDQIPTTYVFFGGQRIARIDPGASSPKYYVTDNVGSTALVTDASGNVLNESLFFPYGVERVVSQGDTANNYRFSGKERDTETGLDDFGARYYDSSLGRFMTPDWAAKPTSVPYASFGDPQTLNLYAYVENGPLNRVDADGHISGLVGQYTVPMDGCTSVMMGACLGDYLQTHSAASPATSLKEIQDESDAIEKQQKQQEQSVQQQPAQKQGFLKRLGSYIYLKGEKGANGAQSGDSVSGKMGPVKGKIEINKDVNEETRHLDGSKSTEHVKESGIGVEIPGVGLIGVTRETSSKGGEAHETHWHFGGERGHASASGGQVGLGVEFCHGECGGIEVGIEAGKIYHDYTHWVTNNPQYF